MSQYVVVGSGPSGIMCATALIERGQRVLMLDVGNRLEPSISTRLNHLINIAPEMWPRQEPSLFKSNYKVSRSGIPFKPIYGSYYPYAMARIEQLKQTTTNCWISEAQGGFSTVWGATVMPYDLSELSRWPVAAEDWRKAYTKIADTIGISARNDDLAENFPIYGSPRAHHRLSAQAEHLLAHWKRNRERLKGSGFLFGASRLAMNAETCRYSQHCHTGCAVQAIYSTTEQLERLKRSELFEYEPGWRVQAVRRYRGSISLIAESVDSGGLTTFSADRVFIGAGVIATTQIVAKSLDRDLDLNMLYHPYFMAPAVLFKGHRKVQEERSHALCQLFLELKDPEISANWVHMQVSTYNPIMRDELARKLKWFGPLARVGEATLLGRLAAVQGYLHSSVSDPIRLRWRDSLQLSAPDMHATHERIREVVETLILNSSRLGMFPLAPLVYMGKPGDGNHIGGVFPMAATPTELQTTATGELKALPGVHLVDASVLPSLPANTITLTVMANAYRIGETVAEKNKERTVSCATLLP